MSVGQDVRALRRDLMEMRIWFQRRIAEPQESRPETESDPVLAEEMADVASIASWCRLAAVHLARTGGMNRPTWAQLADAMKVNDSTLESQYQVWKKREGIET